MGEVGWVFPRGVGGGTLHYIKRARTFHTTHFRFQYFYPDFPYIKLQNLYEYARGYGRVRGTRTETHVWDEIEIGVKFSHP